MLRRRLAVRLVVGMAGVAVVVLAWVLLAGGGVARAAAPVGTGAGAGGAVGPVGTGVPVLVPVDSP